MAIDEVSFTPAAHGRIASALFTLLRDGLLSLPDDTELLDDLATVRLRETAPGQHRVDHDAGRHDDRVIALGLAVAAILNTHNAVYSTDTTSSSLCRSPTPPATRAVPATPVPDR